MRKKILRKISEAAAIISLSLVLTMGCDSAFAMGAAPAESLATNQTMAQAVTTYPQAPAEFRPHSASAAELQYYGFPPRPDPVNHPAAYTRWKKLVSIPRVANPSLQQTKLYNGPIRNVSIIHAPKTGTFQIQSNNWSGSAVTAPTFTFVQNNAIVVAQWVVPRAQQAFGVCSGGWDYSSQWAGFDGFTSNDVLQAGTEADAFCGSSGPASFYSSWVEWFPFSEIRVSVPAVRPGDLMLAEVWYTTTYPYGHAYLANYTLQQAQVYSFDPPPGVYFQGDSAEWILERPGLGSTLTNLTNYVGSPFNYDYAFNNINYFYPGSSPAGTTTYAITMTCPPWSPSSACPSTQAISTPYLYGLWTFWFYDSGPAF
ncbi:MAG TPA: G1 family glutamic endopeptidase [Candidatus Binataceae bacterium]|nr:G1 family glutamic endopeptidase [Candidatus Binataceae bacterium]